MTTVADPAPSPFPRPEFEPDKLRDRYRAERDKRLRPDGNEQYREVAGQFAHYNDDPYTEPFTRTPYNDEVEVVIIGGGFGGLLAGARLREAGINDLRIIETGGDFGGTWYWNRYPGAMCDVESYIYLPLIEELGRMPTEKYAHAPEILEHSRAIARHYDLYRNACLGTQVTEMRWDDASARWVITTDRNDTMRARFVCMAAGPLHRPKLPGVPGVESFRGHSFHTSRWDYTYTGGDSNGGLTGLAGKRVGIIGTGATAVQCVPHLAEGAEHLYVFQRTPSSIDVRNNRPTDPQWAASLQPGWQKQRMDNFNTLVSGGIATEDLVSDGWTDIIRKLLVRLSDDGADLSADGIANSMELADFEKMEQIRARVDAIVRDPETAEALKPFYRQFCKRPCFHDDYLQTYNRPNVTLVDTAGRGVDEITERGVVFDGVEYELDCLVYGTGFEVGTEYSRRAGYELIGRNGQTLTEKWRNGASTLHGMHAEGFPNCFVFSVLQSGFTVNFPHMLDEQSRHLAYILRHVIDNEIVTVEATPAAEAAWVEQIVMLSRVNQKFLEACTPGYYNNEGKPGARGVANTSYGSGPVAFASVLEAWRSEGSLAGLTLQPLLRSGS
jgi:cyclohexanone monooxygenase